MPLVAHLLESFGALKRLEGFVSKNGRAFYQREVPKDIQPSVFLRKVTSGEGIIEETYALGDDSVVPFWAGKELGWEIVERR